MTFEGFRRAALATRTLLEAAFGGKAIAAARTPEEPGAPAHLSWMLAEAIRFYEQGKPQKANRWLGYVQGVMAAMCYASLEELKRANMPEGEVFDAEKL
jgi:hypothetical protein